MDKDNLLTTFVIILIIALIYIYSKWHRTSLLEHIQYHLTPRSSADSKSEQAESYLVRNRAKTAREERRFEQAPAIPVNGNKLLSNDQLQNMLYQ